MKTVSLVSVLALTFASTPAFPDRMKDNMKGEGSSKGKGCSGQITIDQRQCVTPKSVDTEISTLNVYGPTIDQKKDLMMNGVIRDKAKEGAHKSASHGGKIEDHRILPTLPIINHDHFDTNPPPAAMITTAMALLAFIALQTAGRARLPVTLVRSAAYAVAALAVANRVFAQPESDETKAQLDRIGQSDLERLSNRRVRLGDGTEVTLQGNNEVIRVSSDAVRVTCQVRDQKCSVERNESN